MNRFLTSLTILLIGVTLPAFAQTKPNFDFEQRAADGQPAGWNPIGSAEYAFALDSVVKHRGRYALRTAYNTNTGFGGSYWRIPATFGGKKLTLTGFIKTQDTGLEPATFAGLWMRVDNAAGNAVAFDNMQSRGIKGTTDWQRYTITLPLPDEAESIHVGGLLVGKGAAWFDDFELTVDGKPFDKAPVKVVKLAKAQTDTTFNKGSGLELTTLTKGQIESLALLGKVWGFIKYYHPAVAGGNHNMDAELFRVMPNLLKAISTEQRSKVLANWLTTFGPVKAPAIRQPDTATAVHKPDLAWITDDQGISTALRTQLETIRQARRPDEHFYVGMVRQVGNPEFKHEAPYRQMTTPDGGYRLLSLYRFWNIIQYFSPYKHLISSKLLNNASPGEASPGKEWDRVLSEFIPVFVNARDSLSYRLAALSLIGRIHDTHANVWGDQLIQKYYKGEYYAPVQTKFIQNRWVVTNYYHDSLATRSGLRRGDVIQTINSVPVATVIRERQPYYPASNEPTRLRDIGRDLLRGHSNTVQLAIDRDGQPLTLTLNRHTLKQVTLNREVDYSSYPKDSCYQLLHPDIGYLFLGNIKSDRLPQIMRTFKGTKGLVIDLRCYPSEFVVFSLGKYLTTPTPFVKFTAGSIQTPGLFAWQSPLKVGQRGADDAYAGKVVILVNEETQSSAEYHTMAFRQAPGAIVLGSTTAAADGNVSPFELPGGLRTMISGIGVNYPDGRETQRVGVGVDVEMHPTRQGIKEGRDELLEKAIALIRESK